jgi:hypothetical protein
MLMIYFKNFEVPTLTAQMIKLSSAAIWAKQKN